MRFQHRRRAVAEIEIDMADDAVTGEGLPVDPARRHRRDAVDELGLADRPHRGRDACPVHRATLQIHGRADIVAATGIGEELVE